MLVLRDELPDNDKSAISFDITSRTARIFSDKAESAGDYHVGISIVDKSTDEQIEYHQILI